MDGDPVSDLCSRVENNVGVQAYLFSELATAAEMISSEQYTPRADSALGFDDAAWPYVNCRIDQCGWIDRCARVNSRCIFFWRMKERKKFRNGNPGILYPNQHFARGERRISHEDSACSTLFGGGKIGGLFCKSKVTFLSGLRRSQPDNSNGTVAN